MSNPIRNMLNIDNEIDQKKPILYIKIIAASIFVILFAFGYHKNLLEISIALFTICFLTHLFLIKQPIIFFTLIYHTTQATIKVFYAELNNKYLDELGVYSGKSYLSEALILSCIGIIVLGFGIFLTMPKKSQSNFLNFNTKKLFTLYAIFVLLDIFSSRIGLLSGLFQFLYKLSTLKWSIFFLIVYTDLKNKNFLFIYLIVFEILISILSYFASFKNVLFITLISFFILNFHYYKINRKYILFFSSFTLLMLLAWQNIKGEYRGFLSQGEASQVVTVDYDQAFDKIIELSTESSINDNMIEDAINRLSYIDYFAESILYVPNTKPHSDGKLWADGIRHITQPRLFFPNKKAIDDSEKTMEYTGLSLANAEQGTSISLGYVAESYVDFGRLFYIIPLLILGIFIGHLLRLLRNAVTNEIYYWSLSIPIYFQFYGLEIASEKALGAIVTYSIIVAIITFFLKRKVYWLEK